MSTIIEQSIKKVVNKELENPLTCQWVADVLKKLNTGYYNQDWVDVFLQKWDRYPFTIYDAYAFGHVWTWLHLGEIFVAKIFIDDVPGPDKYIEEMNQKLETLWYPFKARFWGGTQDEDGVVEIEEPIIFQSTHTDTGTHYERSISGPFPLEVGYLSVAKTMVYLNGGGFGIGRLARWPYCSKDIWVLDRRSPANPKLEVPYTKREIQQRLPI